MPDGTNPEIEQAGSEATEAQHEAAVTSGDEAAQAPREMEADDDIGFDIDELVDELEDEEIFGEDETPQQEPAKVELQEDESPTKPEQPAKQEVPTQEATEPQVQQPQEPQPAKAEDSVPQVSAEDLQRNFAEFFAKSVGALEQGVYALPPELAEQMDTEPSKVIPRLAATLHMQVLTAAVTKVANMIPGILAMERQRQTIVDSTEQKFYGQYQELADHKDAVNQLARAFRQSNPTASFDEAAPIIAAMAKVQLGLVGSQPTQPQVQPTQSVAPVTPTSVRGSSVPVAPPQEMSVWEELIQED